ncbi:adenylate cyclase, partial [Rhizobium leguminosarum bv. viciae USDA 2370]
MRFVAFAILLANLLLGGNAGAERMLLIVVVSYLVISITSVVTARFLLDRSWLKILFVVLDALLVVSILYGHILGGPVTENHNLTTTSLVVAFILLNHVGLKLDRRLVLIFSGIVLVSWVAMLAATAARHHTADTVSLVGSFFNQDLGLTVSFGFTAF